MDDDDNEQTGTAPEGRHSSDPARTEFWRSQWRVGAIGAGLLMAIVLVVAAVLLAR